MKKIFAKTLALPPDSISLFGLLLRSERQGEKQKR
jgi:hypothetical protein